MKTTYKSNYTATRNACKLCTPLGAALAFKGIEGSVPLLHGSQGCSTYMRRYLISHYKEPVDIASSNFTEETAIFGGGENLRTAIENVARQYSPSMIGIATTCLSETIGDDVPLIVNSMGDRPDMPLLVHVSTPSYSGTHVDGFHGAIRAVADQLNPLEPPGNGISDDGSCRLNLLPGMMSNEDTRHLKEILDVMGVNAVVLPDCSERLDGAPWMEYQVIQEGGTPLEAIRRMRFAPGTLEFGRVLALRSTQGKAPAGRSAGTLLEERFSIPLQRVGIPMGIRETDRFFKALETLSNVPVSRRFLKERGRLIDAYVDCNKYLAGKRAILYGEEDFVVALAAFLSETGIIPVLCASGGKSGYLRQAIEEVVSPSVMEQVTVRDNVDFMEIEQEARELFPDLLVGNSKGYATARRLKIPLVRVGFPIHDRVGGSRILHIGYRGGLQLLDTLVNTLLQTRQEKSDIGYSYM